MRHSGITLLAGAALTACAVAAQPANASTATGFGGHWSAIDSLDGSSLSLFIRGAGDHYAVTELDDSASVCGGAPALVTGAGRVDQETLFTPDVVTCLPGGNVIRQRVTITFTYDAATDSLTDDAGVLWTRTP